MALPATSILVRARPPTCVALAEVAPVLSDLQVSCMASTARQLCLATTCGKVVVLKPTLDPESPYKSHVFK